MICEICIGYAGDVQDNLIRFMAGHHPHCPAFEFNKELFLSEFRRQVDVSANRIVELKLQELRKEIENEYLPKSDKEITSSKIIKKLHWNICNRYFPIIPNSYFFDWESDLLGVNKDNNYITEYEIKISRNDYKADLSTSPGRMT